ncbi:interferon-induced very large GTPase 1-like [Rana temporaria]|uniref:interferon-induced very large GTPase 1-like n=1 Tax=Rana temporaria TaxID=8407 RepID=UPI001AADA9FF|nr:interferon-induced very large GTPase 1-like [Rana temporaria]XP_040215039.1 interferon-induced very large GTPase 1-like [Rana temporaria]XP_040215040.1 interferon-induced very large GTPase 1-like [Rana temporaria]XP_040215041.1 interferon-induced very large GTPase 1-like [Rana temporaria]
MDDHHRKRSQDVLEKEADSPPQRKRKLPALDQKHLLGEESVASSGLEMSSHKPNNYSTNTDLTNKLEEMGLDPKYWLPILEECLGIRNIQSLNFIELEDCSVLEEKIRYPWEKRALHKMFNNSSANISEFQEKRNQFIKEKNKEAHNLIEALKKMTSEGKSRHDDIVKEREKEMWKILEVSPEYSALPEMSLLDLINYFEKQICFREMSFSKTENLTDKEVIQHSSGGLALEGIFQTKNAEDLFKKREPLLCIPEGFKLVGPEQSPVFEQKEFTSQKAESHFHSTVEKIGLSLSSSITAGFMGFSIKSSSNYNNSVESKHTSQQSVQHGYVCTTRYNYIPLASCYFKMDQLRLSPSALNALQKIENVLRIDSNAPDLSTKCSEFFQRFGSHVNLGPIHFGGILWWKASMEGVDSSNMEEAKKMTSEALNMYVGASYAGFGGDIDGSKTNTQGSVHNSKTSSLQKDVQLFVTKTGGPLEADSLPQWKSGLITSNKTWSVIDRGFQLIPVWKIIVDNHREEFTDNLKLAFCLTDHYRSQTGLTTEMMVGENLPNALEKANSFLQGVEFWDVSNAEKHLQELKDFKVELCKTTGSYSAWKTICLSDKNLQAFLVSIVDKYKDDSTEDTNRIKTLMKSLVDPHIYSIESFPNTSGIMRWIHDSDKDKPDIITVSDFEELLNILEISINEVLQVTAKINSSSDDQRQAKIKVTEKISLSLYSFLSSLRKTNQIDTELLLLCIANNSGYCIQNYNFKNLLGYREIEFLKRQMQETYKEYTSIRSQCTDQAQAFVLYTGLTSVGEYQEMSLDKKTERLHFMKKHMAGHISPDVNKIIQQYSEHELHKIEKELRTFSYGESTDMDLEKKIATELNNICKEETTSTKNDITTDYSSVDKNFLLLLKRLDLEMYYPQKMKNADFHKICQPSLVEEQISKEKQLPLHFLQKLLMLDYRARYVQCECNSEPLHAEVRSIQEEEENMDTTDLDLEQFLVDEDEDLEQQNSNCEQPIHPMDVQMSIFHCANDFMRQYLYTKLSFCQFALPLLVTLPNTSSIEFPLWAFQEVKKKWKNKSDKSFDKFIKKTEAPIISFIRLGPSSTSKSQLMNWLISKQRHDIFYHRHCKGSTQNYFLMNGVAEIAWYCPGAKEDDTFDDCIAFTNLHGDATEHDQQVKFLEEISSVIVILFSELDEKGKDLLQCLLKSSKSLICLCANKEKSPPAKGTKVKIGIKNRNEAELLQQISKTIQSLLASSNERYSLDTCASIARKHGFVVDEDKELCKQGREQAKVLLSLLKKNLSAMKEAFLPLQGDLWKKWCKKDKELTRLKQTSNMSIEQQRSNIEYEKQAIRNTQLQRAVPLNDFMKSFLQILFSDSQDSKIYFLRWFSMYLDDLSSKTLSVLYQEYHNKWSKIKEQRELKDKNKQNIETMERGLEELSVKIEVSTFGLEHILREIGQIYEALEQFPEKDESFFKLPKVAANLMVSGYPLELMDGDAAHVPLRWIGAILDELIKILGDKKLYVLSVLGIQSTGKSTLLNAMFGLQFAVSAGRCTRGAFMQLLEVDKELRQEMNFDYVLVVDTEGLKAVELSKNTTLNHDNELATFVIGLGNLTLINIFGENPSEMQDILQIAVQAFLRMKKVNLKPNCVFVHQNVGEITAKEKNMEGRRQLQEKLDKMTLCAAQQEQCDVTCFNEVIKFDVNTNIHYFAHLWEGDPPMAPLNPSYSQNVQMLRRVILESGKREGQHNILNISTFKTRINDLWNALLNEHFVFSFKNSLEIAAYKKLEEKYSQWTWKLRQHMLTLQIKIRNQIYKDEIKQVDKMSLNKQFEEIYGTVLGELKAFFDGEKDKEILVQWRANVEKKLDAVRNELIEEMHKKSKELIRSKKNSKTINQLSKKYEDKMLTESKKLALFLQGKNVTEEELGEKFNKMWISLITKVAEETYTPEPPQINCDLQNVLLEHFKTEPNIADTIKDSCHWKNLLQEFSKYISSKRKLHVLWKEKLSDDEQNTIQRSITILNKRMDKYMDEKQQKKIDYQNIYFHELLKIITSEISITLDTFKFRKEFTLYASLFLCQEAARRFHKISKAFREANDPLVYLGSKRNEFWESFKISCEGKKQITTLADFLCNKLEKAIQQGVYEKSAIHLAGEVNNNNQALNGNRSKLEFCLLRSLAEEENFQQYIDYINDPESAFTDFIQKCVEQYCKDKRNISEILNTKLDEFENVILKAINKSTTIVHDTQGGISEWLDTFCSQLGSDVKLSSDDLKSVKYQNITDIDFLKEAMTQALKTVLKKLKELFSKCNLTHLIQMIHENISEQFSRCWAKCPFCGAVCTNTIPGHDGDHSVQYHRPAALKTWKYRNTNQFCLNICSSVVSSDIEFHPGSDDRSFPYKTYRDAGHPYNTWSITPDNSSLSYWKWVTCFFQRDFENHYNLKFTGLGTIPSQWANITKKEAIEELEKNM